MRKWKRGKAKAGRVKLGLGTLSEPLNEGSFSTSWLGFLSLATDKDVPTRTLLI